MIPSEIIRKVRLIELKTRRIVDDIFGGEYHSAFKGLGMEFAEVREYYPGDDIRAIDWNVTARSGKPYIKKYNEERQLQGLKVEVRNDDVGKALRILKKRMQNEGVFNELRERTFFRKRSNFSKKY